jgi:hypothetical protein
MHRHDIDQLLDVLATIAPGEEAPAPVKIRGARTRVVDRDGEGFEKAARGSVAGGRDVAGTTVPPARRVSSTVRGPDLSGTRALDSEPSS